MTVQTIGISSVVSPDSPPLSLFNYIRNWRTTSPPTFFSCIFSFSWYIWWLCFCSHYLSLDIFIPVSFVSSFQISLPSPFASRPTPLLPSVYLPQLRWRRRCWICKLSSQHIYIFLRGNGGAWRIGVSINSRVCSSGLWVKLNSSVKLSTNTESTLPTYSQGKTRIEWLLKHLQKNSAGEDSCWHVSSKTTLQRSRKLTNGKHLVLGSHSSLF